MDSPPKVSKQTTSNLFGDVEDLNTTFMQRQGGRRGKGRAAFGSKGRNPRALKPSNTIHAFPHYAKVQDGDASKDIGLPEPPVPEPAALTRAHSSFTTSSSLSSTSSGLVAPRPKPKRMQRAMSLNLAPRPSSEDFSTTSLADDLFHSDDFLSRTDDLLEETERDMAFQSRKKRRERRASIMGNLSLSSDYSKNAVEADKSAWLKSTQDSESPEKTEVGLEDLVFSPAMSTASSRKRGVCGSPISDVDDWSYVSGYLSQSSSARNSRTRVFSLEMSTSMPSLPNLAPTFRDSGNSSSKSITERKDPDRRAMDVEDSDDSDSGSDSERDTSMTSHSDVFVLAPQQAAVTMEPSDKDLKFLYNALKKEKGRSSNKLYFGASASWDVVPPHQWDAARRSGFILWAKSLGLSHRSSGKSFVFLQISATRGTELVDRLRQMILDRRKSAPTPPQAPTPASSKMVLDSAIKRPPALEDVSHMETDDLAQRLGDLSVNELRRTVTVDPTRDSLDHHFASSDLQMNLRGETPQKSVVKPMRMSMPSTGPFQRYGGRGASAQSTDLPPILSQDVMETPCIELPSGWGSQPIPGRDWGTSEQCSAEQLQVMTEAMEEALAQSPNEYGDYLSSSLPTMPFDDREKEARVQIQLPDSPEHAKQRKRREKSYAKHKRMSLFVSANHDNGVLVDDKVLFRARESTLFPAVPQSLSPLQEFPAALRASLESEVPSGYGELDAPILARIFGFLTEKELLTQVSLVCTRWSDAGTRARATLLLSSIGGKIEDEDEDLEDLDFNSDEEEMMSYGAGLVTMERDWHEMMRCYPWGRFLSEGTFKKVFKVFNTRVDAEEAIAVMDAAFINDKHMIGIELAVSALLSSLARRAICPNFVMTRSLFTSPCPPVASHWGDANKKCPLGKKFDPSAPRKRLVRPKASAPGRYQYIQMELCDLGDAEEYMKELDDELIPPSVARCILFQIAFALHAAADQFSVKHYDLKLLNVFMQSVGRESKGAVVLRYGLGSHMFALYMDAKEAVMAKVADYGTANIKAESNGEPVTIAQFTTIENTPPDFMILGDEARQGHGHDNFGLGMAMLHLFTGHAPYEEIMEFCVCPPHFKRRLKAIWENEKEDNYKTIRSIILLDVHTDEKGNIMEGEPDETIYDTFYRFLVLFGAPDRFKVKVAGKVWSAIDDCLLQETRRGRARRARNDVEQFQDDRREFSLASGTNHYIARARETLEQMSGGMELLYSLCAFDPSQRAKAMDVLNSPFMEPLRESPDVEYSPDDEIHCYTAFSTHR